MKALLVRRSIAIVVRKVSGYCVHAKATAVHEADGCYQHVVSRVRRALRFGPVVYLELDVWMTGAISMWVHNAQFGDRKRPPSVQQNCGHSRVTWAIVLDGLSLRMWVRDRACVGMRQT